MTHPVFVIIVALTIITVVIAAILFAILYCSALFISRGSGRQGFIQAVVLLEGIPT